VKRDILVANPVAKIDRPSPWRLDDGRARRGRKSASSTARRRDLSNPAARGHASRIGRNVARSAPRRRLGQFLAAYIDRFLAQHVDNITPETPLFWSS
jgi:hypothetical protein